MRYSAALALVIGLTAILSQGGCYLRPTAPETLRIIFTTDTLGNFTPCGCAGGPRGGIERRAAAIQEAREEATGPVILVDTGNFMSGYGTSTERLKADYVTRAMAELGYDAVNVGKFDARMARLGVMEFDQPGVPITSAGYTYEDEETGERLFSYPTSIIVDAGGFKVGFVGSPMDDFDEEILGYQNEPTVTGPELLQLLNEVITVDGASMVIMLTDMSGSWQDARVVGSRFPLASVIIAGESAPSEFVESRTAENIVYPVIVPRADNWGRSVGILDLTLSRHGGILAYDLRYVDLDEEYPKDPGYADMLEEYLAAIEEGPGGVPEYVQTGYVGSDACHDCHLPQSEHWSETRHAEAWETLEETDRLRESTCIPCHVTGFTGHEYVPERLVGYDSRGVGCEACHGPGEVHIMYQEYIIYGTLTDEVRGEDLEDPIILRPSEDVCLACHVAPYDEGWMYATKMNRILHD